MTRASVALLGNPNCGKTTLFNALTGGNQRVGNWPGVTVERKSGSFCESSVTVEVVDLPGTYSLTSISAHQAIDEHIACEAIQSGSFDVVINVVDVTQLERHLYLTAQAVEIGVPMILAVNRMDLLDKSTGHCDFDKLSEQVGCPVVALSASNKQGITELKQAIVQALAIKTPATQPIQYAPLIEEALLELQTQGEIKTRWQALQLLAGDSATRQDFANHQALLTTLLAKIESQAHEEADILIADARYRWAMQAVAYAVQGETAPKNHLSLWLDGWVLHRFWGIPCFLLVMYVMFLFAINFAGVFQDFFDIGSQALLVTGSAKILQQLHSPDWLIAIISQGAMRGLNTTLTFIPVIGAMFFFLSLLESSGYMTRAAFVVDRLMQVMGLPGKSFVPMIVGFGCNVPAIMAARTLENPRDRVLTIMMSPFMSCGARLAIFAVFTAAFFPTGGHNIVFALYIIGIAMAILTGLVLRNTLLRGESAPLVMEMPSYHRPLLSVLLRQTWYRLKHFLVRAGMIIVPVCMLIGALNHLQDSTQHQTVLAKIGQTITPAFRPMGIRDENWPATVGLLTGVLSKEVVIATLNTLYSQDAAVENVADQSVLAGLYRAVVSVPQNIFSLKDSVANPVLASAPIEESSSSVYGVMYERFGSSLAAFSYLLFILLYVPCISATAAMVRELNRGWALFSVFWTTGVAYGTAVLFYQLAQIGEHFVESLSWTLGISACFSAVFFLMRRYAAQHAPAEVS